MELPREIWHLIVQRSKYVDIYDSIRYICKSSYIVCRKFVLAARARNKPPKINMRWIIEFYKFIRPTKCIKIRYSNSLKSMLYFSRKEFRRLTLHDKLMEELDFVLYDNEIDWEYVHHKGDWGLRCMYFIKRPKRKIWIKNYQSL